MKKLFYAISMLLLAACSGSPSIDLSVINVNTSELSNLTFNDLYEVKKVIPLETTEESLLGANIGISYVNDHIYIRTGAHWINCNEYLVFNNNGQFLYKNNKVGRGPGEYLKITSLHFNGDSTIVANGNKLIYYNANGEFISENSAMPDKRYFDMFYVGDGNILAAYLRPEAREGNYYSLQLISKEGQYLNGFLPIPEAFIKTLTFSGHPLFIRNSNSIYYTPMVRNAIYEYNPQEKELKEIYQIIVDNKPIFDVNSIDFTDNWYLENNKVWINSITREHMLLTIANPAGTYYASVNRANNHTELFNKTNFTDNRNALPISPIFGEEEDLISLVTYKGLESLTITDTTSIGYKLKQSMTESSNPVIVLYKKK